MAAWKTMGPELWLVRRREELHRQPGYAPHSAPPYAPPYAPATPSASSAASAPPRQEPSPQSPQSPQLPQSPQSQRRARNSEAAGLNKKHEGHKMKAVAFIFVFTQGCGFGAC